MFEVQGLRSLDANFVWRVLDFRVLGTTWVVV